ncbi:WSC domain-containing protein [Coccidioides immitis RS]|uniref:WSC domain-containing protein n=3 Tax=Coccidioides immitis TaxID=5501 RepID=J3K876_COCIM|nr:WSC domain-containing protein [Coccidioides immitis RS]EAS31001.3 WSC domain-containing protein [Coccidioides immitis RS]KMP03602.1 hypothetical protein CIRG_03293 [Coccidioides immitis RMSCC 2394]KMU73191.1 hypothetical protein CISG_03450 [Coccidioides immitis RMSCC 3703]TPX23869.1 hypothetical protein DIZ76_013212 [Coccidioides immitis]
MQLNALNLAAAAAALSSLAVPATAFWRLPCRGVSGVGRIDPIVDPGIPSPHVHSVHGGKNFAMTVTSEELLASECTSCAVVQDKSAYWTPSLYFIHANGEAELVKQVGGMLVYYLPRGENVEAFPRGFRMVAGDTYQRNFTLPVPDPPKSTWSKDDKTQFALSQKALGFNCLNYNADAEPALMRHSFPERTLLDSQCTHGVRMELVFPSCWNGKDLDSPDHRSHVAYPDLVDGGSCPEGHERRLVTLFYETIWDTYAFKGKEGEFVVSNGDPTGYGYHGDFIEAWDGDVLERAIKQCTNPSGKVEDCPVFKLQEEHEQKKCKFSQPAALVDELVELNPEGLPGKVPVMRGPEYAKHLMPHPPASKPSPPKVKLPVPETPVMPTSKATMAPQPSETEPPAPPVDKPAPEIPYTTSYSTQGTTVYEIVVIRKTVTKTVELTAPTPHAKRHESSNVKGRLRRHRYARRH